MATAPPPPPAPPPPALPGNLAPKTPPKPHPQPAAIPFNGYPPIQETFPSPETLPDAQGEEAPPLFQVQNGSLSQSPEGQEDVPSESEEKCHPVQETDPAPQALNGPQVTEQQDEQATHMDPAGEGQLA
ncbi:branchpoint-bridging protein-like isoform X2 [Xiphias gladius]|uniref:branchpoint-bridging protein-like isoform X2 n=1 Tax=Xiphias gladius TaxID=8245 RepID=UPI001A99AD90|nr:branchpoint-bridging protein-like isoform X2 [Xiphias gladius]